MASRLHSAWLVDLDGTLYSARPIKVVMAAEAVLLGWRALPTIRRFRREHEQLRREAVEAQESPYALQITRTAHHLGVQPAAVEAVVNEWMIRRPGKWIRLFRRRCLIREITAFRAAGGRTALVSDYPASTKLAALGVRALFDVVVASGEADGPHRLKPDPEGYLLAAERLAVEPHACLVLGDRVDADGAAAKRAEMDFRLIE